MTHYEMVELLREKANVSYEEAKNALEAADWDLLDAIVLLEREGKTSATSTTYSTQSEPEPEQEQPKRSEFKDNMKRLGGWLAHLIEIGNRNSFVISKHGKELFHLPVTAAVLVLCISWPLTLVLLIIGLFAGCRYSFRGPQLGTDTVNNVMNKVNDAAETVKAEFTNDNNEQ